MTFPFFFNVGATDFCWHSFETCSAIIVAHGYNDRAVDTSSLFKDSSLKFKLTIRSVSREFHGIEKYIELVHQ